jgi:DNA-binding LacI/PurR family transcriptional regulator
MAKATIRDVAKLAGVSTATVSKVLNGTGRISAGTSVRVANAMEELQYHPSMIARALKKNQTYSIGLLVPDITNSFYAELMRAIEDEALSRNYFVLVCSTDNSPERERKQLELLMGKQLDGLIIATADGMSSDSLKMLRNSELRVVFIDRVVPDSPYPVIAADHYAGSYQAMEHLIQLGHRKLAVFAEPLYLRPSQERLRGFFAALEAYGLPRDSSPVLNRGFGAQAGYELAQRLLLSNELPTAIFATNDLIALGALQKFHEVGISIPDQLSLMGYDDIQMAKLASPPLTTIAQPIAEMCRLAVEYLFSDRPPSTTITLLLPKLIIRNSTAAPRES